MQVTTGHSSIRTQLLSKLSLAIGVIVMSITLLLIFFYGWLEQKDLYHLHQVQHQKVAKTFISFSQQPDSNLDFENPEVMVQHLSKYITGLSGISALIWSSDDYATLFAKTGHPTPAKSLHQNLTSNFSPDGVHWKQDFDNQNFYSSYYLIPSGTKTYLLELRHNLTDELSRISAGRNQISVAALLLEGLLIFAMYFGAKRADKKIQESEKEQDAMESELFFLAHYDTLTHLPNRALFWERLDASITRAQRLGKSVALLNFDITNFAHLNEDYGRTVGDQCLVEIARRLQAAARAADLVCRIGADEFVIVLEDLDPIKVQGATQRLLQSIQKQMAPPFELSSPIEKQIVLSLQGGGSTFPQDGNTSEELLMRAQSALLKAKQQKEFFIFYTK